MDAAVESSLSLPDQPPHMYSLRGVAIPDREHNCVQGREDFSVGIYDILTKP